MSSIASRSFYNCTKLSEVRYPAGWTTTPDYDNSTTYYGYGSGYSGYRSPFEGCTALKKIEIPEGVTEIPYYAFRYQTSLEEVILPESLTNIAVYAFDGCTGLKTVEFNIGLETIESYAFWGCTSLTEVEMPANMTTIGGYAFDGCTNLRIINLGEGLTTISDSAFRNCTNLGVLTLPANVTSIGNYAFYNCIGLRMINMNDKLKSIGSYAFYGCDGVLSLILNDGLESIADNSFANCANLTAVEIPDSVSSVETTSFSGCSKLKIYCNSGTEAHMVSEAAGYNFVLLDDHDHEYETIIETAATCTRGGSQIKKCTICGYNYIELVDSLGHEYSASVKAPNCSEEGYTIHTCVRGDDTYNDNYVEPLGHSYGEWQIEKAPDCTEGGSRYRVCNRCNDEDSESVESLGHNYGEWIVEQAATVLAEGSQYRECIACDEVETQSIDRIVVDIEKNTEYGLAVFEVVNAQTLEPIENAQIFVSTEKDGENLFTTDEKGQVSIVLPVGKLTISAYADGCLTRNLNIIVSSGINQIQQIGLSDKPTYDAEITSKLMTIEEIEAAGIDTSDPSNQHVYKYELRLEFEPEIDWASIVAYFNADGEFIGGYSPDNGPSVPPEEGEGEGEETYTLHYHVVNDGFWHSWCKNEKVEKGQDAALTYHPWRDSDDYIFDGWYEDESFTKKIYSKHIEDYTTYVYGRWIYVGEEEEEPKTAVKGIRVPVKDGEEVITVYPVTEYFYLIIRGEVKWLKEMFDVEMLVINNSQTDTLENLTATLSLPEGLSLAAMIGEEQTLAQKIDHIAEGESKSVHWYVRGDTAGSYDIKARLQGMVMPFEEPIDDVFIAENQLQVWAGNALHLHFEFPSAAYYGEDYPIRITLTNVSDIPLYNISHKVQIEQGTQIFYSDGTSKEKIETSEWESYGTRVFNPGDQIIIETSVNIFFESEIMKMELEKLIGVVDGAEQLLNAYNAVQTAVDATDELISCVSGCSKALKKFNFSSGGDKDKLELFKQLYSKISDLELSYSTSGNKTMDAAVKLANSGVNASLNAITSDPDEWLKKHSVSDIKKLMDKVSALESSITSNGETTKKFDIFDSLRTVISAIPVRFVLKNVIMMEDENNTTSIPWSYSASESSARYFGVSSVSKLLMSYIQVISGEIYEDEMPSLIQLIPGLDDPFNKEEAIKYIQATENEIAQFKAKDATGEVTFRAWIERNNTENISLLGVSAINETEDFLLSCDNDSAVYENGVLTFTGDGMISVTPQSRRGGTLYIEDSEGNLYTYVINVVEQHECMAGEQQAVIVPTEDYDGFAVKCCETCGEIMEIIPLHFEDCCEEHIFNEWSTELEATCIEGGIQTRACTDCGKIEYQFVDMRNHTSGE